MLSTFINIKGSEMYLKKTATKQQRERHPYVSQVLRVYEQREKKPDNEKFNSTFTTYG